MSTLERKALTNLIESALSSFGVPDWFIDYTLNQVYDLFRNPEEVAVLEKFLPVLLNPAIRDIIRLGVRRDFPFMIGGYYVRFNISRPSGLFYLSIPFESGLVPVLVPFELEYWLYLGKVRPLLYAGEISSGDVLSDLLQLVKFSGKNVPDVLRDTASLAEAVLNIIPNFTNEQKLAILYVNESPLSTEVLDRLLQLSREGIIADVGSWLSPITVSDLNKIISMTLDKIREALGEALSSPIVIAYRRGSVMQNVYVPTLGIGLKLNTKSLILYPTEQYLSRIPKASQIRDATHGAGIILTVPTTMKKKEAEKWLKEQENLYTEIACRTLGLSPQEAKEIMEILLRDMYS